MGQSWAWEEEGLCEEEEGHVLPWLVGEGEELCLLVKVAAAASLVSVLKVRERIITLTFIVLHGVYVTMCLATPNGAHKDLCIGTIISKCPGQAVILQGAPTYPSNPGSMT